MYTLSNSQLTVSILDPVADQGRFGVRYCTGGYIFQVEDSRLGALLSGPTYPDTFNWFDGQGIPDAFNLHPLHAKESNDPALIIGIGLCNLTERTVTEFCTWDVAQSDNAIRMIPRHDWQGFGMDLERTVSLHGRSVLSHTRLINRGGAPLPFRWFPHPFYPQTSGDELLKVSIPVQVGENPGYELAPNGFICRKGWPWDKGYYLALDHTAGRGLTLIQRHPLLGTVTATCSYDPTYFPIWGNPRTFSWEPFLERTVGPGLAAEWQIDYDF